MSDRVAGDGCTGAITAAHCVHVQIKIEDFRQMTESCGMQLDDDSLLALFSRVSRRQRQPMQNEQDRVLAALEALQD